MFNLRKTSPNLNDVYVCGECRLGEHNIIMKNKRTEDRVKSKDCTGRVVTRLEFYILINVI
ncbi:hypothetical protein HanRHA438_Chr17g0831521 [Helianthus annuus]|nr:hypothetical protein HanIR_Chr17g0891921 [Helianthus annuus]KAJ0827935.1 hypothetical protein HanRHA438_Chr17g0831521 [Helianthus annuus]